MKVGRVGVEKKFQGNITLILVFQKNDSTFSKEFGNPLKILCVNHKLSYSNILTDSLSRN